MLVPTMARSSPLVPLGYDPKDAPGVDAPWGVFFVPKIV